MKRREFIKAAIAGAAAFAVPPTLLTTAFAGQRAGQTSLGVVRRTIEVNGKAASVFGLHQADGRTARAAVAGGRCIQRPASQREFGGNDNSLAWLDAAMV